VLITALGSWGKPVPRGICVVLGVYLSSACVFMCINGAYEHTYVRTCINGVRASINAVFHILRLLFTLVYAYTHGSMHVCGLDTFAWASFVGSLPRPQ
jgi:hypothetical protein